ncbi:unnamed protein product [Pleuronectes platessa]|uniref:Uncharacterized protein n=1 Tax=Pleuronectes platessa TaxID=8262 RepID=A0A9N7ZAP7_PLEPL|nr:unnamed protein product [Pleuronectes platessa]
MSEPRHQVNRSLRQVHQAIRGRGYTNWLLLLRPTTENHDFWSLAHPNQVTPCEGNYWLLSQTFPEVIGRSDEHSARDLYNELPPTEVDKTFPEVIGRSDEHSARDLYNELPPTEMEEKRSLPFCCGTVATDCEEHEEDALRLHHSIRILLIPAANAFASPPCQHDKKGDYLKMGVGGRYFWGRLLE